jgi:hypothetical protein
VSIPNPEIKSSVLQKRTTIILLALGLASLSLACGMLFNAPVAFRQRPLFPGQDQPTGISNGERIYFTGLDSQGRRIRYSGGPPYGGMMMGAYLACVDCHGPDGRGGLHTMHMQVMEAPDIRFAALLGEAEEHAGEEHENNHGDYTLEEFRLAVVEGKHPDGEPLSTDMPRWQIGDQDLADLFEFLKSLP